MAAKSNLKNMALCLTAVCLVCSSILALVYVATVDPIEQAQKAKTNAAIAKVLPEFSADVVPGSVVLGDVEYSYFKAPGAGYAITSVVSGFSGPLSVMVGITEAGIVHNTSTLSHSETPGLGAKCQTDAAFIDQFKSWDPAQKKLMVKKDGGDVDAITASTITSRAYSLAIANALEAYKEIVKNEGGQNNE